MNKPHIRFEGFSGEWEQRELKAIAPLQRGFDLPKADIKVGNYPVVMSNGINGYHSEFKAKGPGVVTGRSGTIGQLNYIESDYWPHNTALWVTDFKNNNPKFIYHLYNKIDLSRFRTGSGVPTLNRNDVHDTTAFIPMNSEQKQISSLLSIIDNIIKLHQQEHEKTKNLKKAMLEKMFPKEGSKIPEIRFVGFSEEWEEKQLKEIINSEFKGKAKAEMQGNQSEYLDAERLNGGLKRKVDCKTDTVETDVLILWDGSQAGTVYHGFNGALGSTLKAYKTSEYGEFVFQQLKKNQQLIYDKYRTPNIPHVVKTFTEDFLIYIPIFEEQIAIGNFFKNLDETISLQKKQIEHLQNIKKSLLEKMFV